MSRKVKCRWNDKVECKPERQMQVDDSNKAKPINSSDFQFCAECMLRKAMDYLGGYDRMDFTKMDKESMSEYFRLGEQAKILKSQWNEYWKEQEKIIDEGSR